MWKMLWPVAVVVLSNVFYHICQKSTPNGVNPFCALIVTYMVGAIASAILFVIGVGPSHVAEEFHKLNWTSIALGAAIIGLEVGTMFLYRNGWKVSTGSIVCNVALAIVLVIVGVLLYKEHVSIRQIIGVAVCCVGIALITT